MRPICPMSCENRLMRSAHKGLLRNFYAQTQLTTGPTSEMVPMANCNNSKTWRCLPRTVATCADSSSIFCCAEELSQQAFARFRIFDNNNRTSAGSRS